MVSNSIRNTWNNACTLWLWSIIFQFMCFLNSLAAVVRKLCGVQARGMHLISTYSCEIPWPEASRAPVMWLLPVAPIQGPLGSSQKHIFFPTTVTNWNPYFCSAGMPSSWYVKVSRKEEALWESQLAPGLCAGRLYQGNGCSSRYLWLVMEIRYWTRGTFCRPVLPGLAQSVLVVHVMKFLRCRQSSNS